MLLFFVGLFVLMNILSLYIDLEGKYLLRNGSYFVILFNGYGKNYKFVFFENGYVLYCNGFYELEVGEISFEKIVGYGRFIF